MRIRKRAAYKELENRAIAFLSRVESPEPPQRLAIYGLQRVLARAEAGEGASLAKRNVYRTPSFIYRLVLVLIMILLLLALSGAGAYAFSYNSQPGSTLYGTKIFFERARLALTLSAAGDLRLEITYCDRRMEELQQLAASGRYQGAERWLQEYRRNILEAASLVGQLPPQEAEALSQQFLQALERQSGRIEELRRAPSLELVPQVEEAYRICTGEMERERQRHGANGGMIHQDMEDESPEKGGDPGGQEKQGDENGRHGKECFNNGE
jgi:hypothetical protein